MRAPHSAGSIVSSDRTAGSRAFSVRGVLREMTKADLAVSIGTLALGVAVPSLLRPGVPPERAFVLVGKEIVASLPLGENATIEVAGAVGPVSIEVSGEAVRVRESSCANKICVGMGWKRHAGDMLACVPNALLVRIDGAPNEDRPDAISP
jgi:hypothetical protein